MMLDEPFARGDSPIHRRDPRIRLLAATVFSVVVAVSKAPPTLAAAVAISLGLCFAAHLHAADVFKRLLVVGGFLLILWAVLPVTYGGKTLANLGPLAISRPGIVLAAQISFKSSAIVLALVALVATMPLIAAGQALGRLRVPDKLVHLLLMTYRYLFVIAQEYERLVRAARIRGFKPASNLHTYRTYAYIVGMLFVRAHARAERVHQAMRCRGFRRRFYTLGASAADRRDWCFAVIMAGAVAGLLGTEWLYRV